uniref:(northern house mosquito) hypothetical protein n=1 Tax=Culex pipiens TaxID=7175 RepID=A0A8D8K0N1_CULPI
MSYRQGGAGGRWRRAEIYFGHGKHETGRFDQDVTIYSENSSPRQRRGRLPAGSAPGGHPGALLGKVPRPAVPPDPLGRNVRHDSAQVWRPGRRAAAVEAGVCLPTDLYGHRGPGVEHLPQQNAHRVGAEEPRAGQPSAVGPVAPKGWSPWAQDSQAAADARYRRSG